MKHPLVVIVGPTAVGKSRLAIEIAKELNGVIISADSMQVYKGMNIGTAKIEKDQRENIPHYLIDIRDPDQDWSVVDFIEEVKKLIPQIHKRGKLPIIVGGTGFYLWALLKGFSFPIIPADKELRARLEKESVSTLYSRLSTIDSKAAEKIHPNDKKRIIRALEVYELTGKPISEFQKNKVSDSLRLNMRGHHISPLLIGLILPREELYAHINQRVDSMLEKGLIKEVQNLLAEGCSKNLSSFQALGYKEVVSYLEGKYNFEEMVALLKKNTRKFAKRQITWFKRFENIRWFDSENLNTVEVIKYIKEESEKKS